MILARIPEEGFTSFLLITNKAQPLSHRPLHTVPQTTDRGRRDGEESDSVPEGSEFGEVS